MSRQYRPSLKSISRIDNDDDDYDGGGDYQDNHHHHNVEVWLIWMNFFFVQIF